MAKTQLPGDLYAQIENIFNSKTGSARDLAKVIKNPNLLKRIENIFRAGKSLDSEFAPSGAAKSSSAEKAIRKVSPARTKEEEGASSVPVPRRSNIEIAKRLQESSPETVEQIMNMINNNRLLPLQYRNAAMGLLELQLLELKEESVARSSFGTDEELRDGIIAKIDSIEKTMPRDKRGNLRPILSEAYNPAAEGAELEGETWIRDYNTGGYKKTPYFTPIAFDEKTGKPTKWKPVPMSKAPRSGDPREPDPRDLDKDVRAPEDGEIIQEEESESQLAEQLRKAGRKDEYGTQIEDHGLLTQQQEQLAEKEFALKEEAKQRLFDRALEYVLTPQTIDVDKVDKTTSLSRQPSPVGVFGFEGRPQSREEIERRIEILDSRGDKKSKSNAAKLRRDLTQAENAARMMVNYISGHEGSIIPAELSEPRYVGYRSVDLGENYLKSIEQLMNEGSYPGPITTDIPAHAPVVDLVEGFIRGNLSPGVNAKQHILRGYGGLDKIDMVSQVWSDMVDDPLRGLKKDETSDLLEAVNVKDLSQQGVNQLTGDRVLDTRIDDPVTGTSERTRFEQALEEKVIQAEKTAESIFPEIHRRIIKDHAKWNETTGRHEYSEAIANTGFKRSHDSSRKVENPAGYATAGLESAARQIGKADLAPTIKEALIDTLRSNEDLKIKTPNDALNYYGGLVRKSMGGDQQARIERKQLDREIIARARRKIISENQDIVDKMSSDYRMSTEEEFLLHHMSPEEKAIAREIEAKLRLIQELKDNPSDLLGIVEDEGVFDDEDLGYRPQEWSAFSDEDLTPNQQKQITRIRDKARKAIAKNNATSGKSNIPESVAENLFLKPRPQGSATDLYAIIDGVEEYLGTTSKVGRTQKRLMQAIESALTVSAPDIVSTSGLFPTEPTQYVEAMRTGGPLIPDDAMRQGKSGVAYTDLGEMAVTENFIRDKFGNVRGEKVFTTPYSTFTSPIQSEDPSVIDVSMTHTQTPGGSRKIKVISGDSSDPNVFEDAEDMIRHVRAHELGHMVFPEASEQAIEQAAWGARGKLDQQPARMDAAPLFVDPYRPMYLPEEAYIRQLPVNMPRDIITRSDTGIPDPQNNFIYETEYGADDLSNIISADPDSWASTYISGDPSMIVDSTMGTGDLTPYDISGIEQVPQLTSATEDLLRASAGVNQVDMSLPRDEFLQTAENAEQQLEQLKQAAVQNNQFWATPESIALQQEMNNAAIQASMFPRDNVIDAMPADPTFSVDAGLEASPYRQGHQFAYLDPMFEMPGPDPRDLPWMAQPQTDAFVDPIAQPQTVLDPNDILNEVDVDYDPNFVGPQGQPVSQPGFPVPLSGPATAADGGAVDTSNKSLMRKILGAPKATWDKAGEGIGKVHDSYTEGRIRSAIDAMKGVKSRFEATPAVLRGGLGVGIDDLVEAGIAAQHLSERRKGPVREIVLGEDVANFDEMVAYMVGYNQDGEDGKGYRYINQEQARGLLNKRNAIQSDVAGGLYSWEDHPLNKELEKDIAEYTKDPDGPYGQSINVIEEIDRDEVSTYGRFWDVAGNMMSPNQKPVNEPEAYVTPYGSMNIPIYSHYAGEAGSLEGLGQFADTMAGIALARKIPGIKLKGKSANLGDISSKALTRGYVTEGFSGSGYDNLGGGFLSKDKSLTVRLREDVDPNKFAGKEYSEQLVKDIADSTPYTNIEFWQYDEKEDTLTNRVSGKKVNPADVGIPNYGAKRAAWLKWINDTQEIRRMQPDETSWDVIGPMIEQSEANQEYNRSGLKWSDSDLGYTYSDARAAYKRKHGLDSPYQDTSSRGTDGKYSFRDWWNQPDYMEEKDDTITLYHPDKGRAGRVDIYNRTAHGGGFVANPAATRGNRSGTMWDSPAARVPAQIIKGLWDMGGSISGLNDYDEDLNYYRRLGSD